MTEPSPTISADELGPMLKPSLKDAARWLQRHHQRLTETEGLPRKLPGGWVWSRLAVMAWIAHYGAPREARIIANINTIRQQQKNILDGLNGRAA